LVFLPKRLGPEPVVRHNNQLITSAPNPATTPAVIIDPVEPPTAADLVVELAAAALAVVEPLTSWFTTETTTFEEFEHLSLARVVALLLNVISAHYPHISACHLISSHEPGLTLYNALPVSPKVTA